MNEAVVQAIIRLAVGGALAAIGWVVANVTILAGAIPDPAQAGLVITVLVAALNFITKLMGGPTAKAPVTHGRGAPAGSLDRPSILSV